MKLLSKTFISDNDLDDGHASRRGGEAVQIQKVPVLGRTIQRGGPLPIVRVRPGGTRSCLLGLNISEMLEKVESKFGCSSRVG